MAQLDGTESVDGREAFVVRADNVGRTQRTEDGQEFTIHTLSLWIDSTEYVPLRLKLDGTATSDGETRAITIEKHDEDYRRVGSLYVPYRQVMRIAGVMDAEQKAQMQEAQQQMAELERQMQEMPESQRNMIMSSMGPQLEMMKKMASGGGIEVVTEVHEVRVNAGMPDQVALVSAKSSAQASPTADKTAAPAAGTEAAGPAAAQDPAALREAQQACLQRKMAEAREAQKKKRGLGRLMRAVTRTASRSGDRDVARAMGDVYSANATAEDLSAAARDLGLSDDEVAACQDP